MAEITAERKKAFDAIDTDGSGIISFEEWSNHFAPLHADGTQKTAGDMSEDQLYCMFYAYDVAGDKEGIDINEYAAFMRDVYDPLEA